MSFVENNGGEFRKNSASAGSLNLLAYREISEEEMVIHDDDVALHRLAVHLRDKAAVELRASF